MRSTPLVVALAAAIGLAGACASSESAVLDSAPASNSAAPPDSAPPPTAAAPPPASPADSTALSAADVDRATELCSRSGTEVVGTIENPALTEASGLVASRSHPGVLWSHNDGPDGAGVFGVGADGSDLGFHPLDTVEAVDVEDIAILGGPDGDELLLADIGDNGLGRGGIRLLRFDEPDPTAPGPVATVEVLEFTYPDGPHNAETLLVDERDERFVIVTKEQELVDGRSDPFGRTAPSFVFDGELDGSKTVLRFVGTLDTTELEAMNNDPASHPASLLGFGGVPTGGDVAVDGSVVALRTYETVWVWQRRPDESVADALFEVPCQVRTVSERQGEAVAFLGDDLITVGEGDRAELHALGR